VDGLKDDLAGQAAVLQLDLFGDIGDRAAERYGVRAVPVTLLIDGDGNEVLRQLGLPNAGAIRDAVAALHDE
jgi:hypothetical protein